MQTIESSQGSPGEGCLFREFFVCLQLGLSTSRPQRLPGTRMCGQLVDLWNYGYARLGGMKAYQKLSSASLCTWVSHHSSSPPRILPHHENLSPTGAFIALQLINIVLDRARFVTELTLRFPLFLPLLIHQYSKCPDRHVSTMLVTSSLWPHTTQHATRGVTLPCDTCRALTRSLLNFPRGTLMELQSVRC